MYFPMRGRGEPIRYILAQAEVEYEDKRVPREEWPTIKPTTPLGQMPVLEVDGKMLAQSVAIGRYLARKHHLTGVNDWEAARCDMIVDWVQDFTSKVRPIAVAFMSGDQNKVKEALAEAHKEAIPQFLAEYEKLLKENGDGWLVGKNVTWADLWVGDMGSKLLNFDANVCNGHAAPKAHYDKVHALPNIKKWVEKRPQTPM